MTTDPRVEDAHVVAACPGCGLLLPRLDDGPPNPQANASAECRRLCHKLLLYTLSHGDPFFIHQTAVDAYAAQPACPASKRIAVTFALLGRLADARCRDHFLRKYCFDHPM